MTILTIASMERIRSFNVVTSKEMSMNEDAAENQNQWDNPTLDEWLLQLLMSVSLSHMLYFTKYDQKPLI